MTQLRAFWINAALLMVKPVLHSICNEQFKDDFPSLEMRNLRTTQTCHLEALGRSLQGVAPWLELQQDPEAVELALVARCAIAKATDPKSSQYMTFTAPNRQPLVDAAILAHALLRAPTQLWGKLDNAVKANVIAALGLTRSIPPHVNNWLLFVSMIETFMYINGQQTEQDRLLEGLRMHRAWYLGDGWWGDGPELAHDYYNSFVIQPMLYDIFAALNGRHPVRKGKYSIFHRHDARGLDDLDHLVTSSLPRSAAYLESLIHADGTYPAVGRSIVYRCGAFHILSLAALKGVLPMNVPPGQARTALTRVLNRTLGAHAYDKNGWLYIGVVGSQPHLAQVYISQGSVYQAAAVFLPLGLSAADPFWTDPEMPTTSEKIWGGATVAAGGSTAAAAA